MTAIRRPSLGLRPYAGPVCAWCARPVRHPADATCSEACETARRNAVSVLAPGGYQPAGGQLALFHITHPNSNARSDRRKSA